MMINIFLVSLNQCKAVTKLCIKKPLLGKIESKLGLFREKNILYMTEYFRFTKKTIS